MFLGKKAMTNLDSTLKSRDIEKKKKEEEEKKNTNTVY